MAETHTIQCRGFQILKEYLAAHNRHVDDSDNSTFDFIVDGEYAEVKTKSKGWDQFDFIGLTIKQKKELGNKLKKIFVVLNALNPSAAEIIEIDADELVKCQCKEINHYEWNKGDIQHLRRK